MLDQTWLWLTGTDPSHAAEDRVSWVEFAKRNLVSHAILDDDECRIVVRDRFEERWYLADVGGFMSAYDVVKWLACF